MLYQDEKRVEFSVNLCWFI